MLFALEARLNGSQLTILTDSLLLQSLDDLLIRLLYGLGLIILNHDLI